MSFIIKVQNAIRNQNESEFIVLYAFALFVRFSTNSTIHLNFCFDRFMHIIFVVILRLILQSTVCPQSPFGVLKNCGAQTN
jgi:hypothetical protein